jgi:putative ATP-binding cassette transporter
MPGLVDRLDEVGHWNMMLSGGEQQRVGIARAMLYNPDYLFFDEATASMDEPSEEELYTMLLERMKETTIISIGHRSSLEKFHKRILYAEKVPAGNYEFQERL